MLSKTAKLPSKVLIAEQSVNWRKNTLAQLTCMHELIDVQERSGVWGEGLDLVLELDEGSLKLLRPDTGQLLNSQPIHAIR